MRFSRILPILTLALAACTSDDRPRLDHAPAPVEARDSRRSAQQSTEIPQPVLRESNLANPRITGSVAFKKALHAHLQELVAQAAKDSRTDLGEFTRAVLAGCDESLNGCRNWRALRSSPLSAKLVLVLAAREKQVEVYYRWLKIAYEIKNATYDHELTLHYLERAAEYAEHLNRVGQNNLAQNHGRVLATLLADFQSRARPGEATRILETFQIWNFSRRQPGQWGAVAPTLFALAAKDYLYVDGRTNPALTKFIAADQRQAGSFDQRLSTLSRKNPYLLKALGVSTSSAKDEYFYMVDRLMRGHLGLDEAAALWSSSRKDRTKLAVHLRAVLYVELLTVVNEANLEMRKHFELAHKMPVRKMLNDTIERSASLIPRFQSFLARAKIVRDFMERALRADGEDETYRVTRRLYDSLDNNIKFMVTYPHMLMLAHHLSKEKFEMTVRFYWFDITIDSARILQAVLDGVYAPWFGYSNDQTPLSTTDILYAVYFAFQLDTFSDFQVEPSEFLLGLAKSTLGQRSEAMRLHAELIERHFFRSPAYAQYRRLCEQVRITGRIDLPVTLEDFLERPMLSRTLRDQMVKVGGALAVTFNPGGISVGRFADGFSLNSAINAKSVEELRTVLTPRQLTIQAMAQSYKTVMAQAGKTPAQIATASRQVDDYLERIETEKFHVVQNLIRAYRESNGCADLFDRADRERRDQIMILERAHLARIHRYMTLLQKQTHRVDEFNREMATDTRALRVAPADRFDEKSFHYHRLDFVARAVGFNRQLDPRARVDFPPDFRAVVGGLAAPLRVPLAVTVEYHPDVDTFVDRAFKIHYNPMNEVSAAGVQGATRWTAWYNYNSALIYFGLYERKMLASLNRLGPVQLRSGERSDTIRPADLIEAVAAQARKINPMPAEVEAYRRFGLNRLHPTQWLRDMYVNFQTGDPVPIFEDMFGMMTSPLLGDFYVRPSEASQELVVEPQFKAWRDQGSQYVLSRKFRTSFIVPIDPAFDQYLDQQVKTRVLQDIRAVWDFAHAVREREERDDRTRQRIHVAIEFDQPAPAIRYLNPAQVQDFGAQIVEFNKVTGGFFQAPTR